MGKQLHYGGPQTSHSFCLLEMRFPSLGETYISGRSLRACMCVFIPNLSPVDDTWQTESTASAPALVSDGCRCKISSDGWTRSVLRDSFSSLQRFLNNVSKQDHKANDSRNIFKGLSSLIVLATRLVLEISCYNGSFKETRLLNLFVDKNKEFLPTYLHFNDEVKHDMNSASTIRFSFVIWQRKTSFYIIDFLWHQGDLHCE